MPRSAPDRGAIGREVAVAGLDGGLSLVIEFGPIGPEELDAVVGSGVVTGADHDPEGGPEVQGEVGNRTHRDDAQIDGVEARAWNPACTAAASI